MSTSRADAIFYTDLAKKAIREKLEESIAVASDPNAKRYTHEEIFTPLREKYGYEIQT